MAKSKGKSKKKNNSKVIEEVMTDDTSLVDKLFIAGGVLLFILAFYGLTVYITNKNSDSTEEETEKTVEVSNDTIILGRSLSMGNEYYVVYYDSGNATMDEIVNNYNGELKLYKVDMSSAFNKKYKTDGESNKNPSKVSDFSINGSTLIKVSNKKVVEYIEGEDTIRTILN